MTGSETSGTAAEGEHPRRSQGPIDDPGGDSVRVVIADDETLLREGLARRRLGQQVGQARLWLGTLRRLVQATSIESSTRIEGFHVPTEEAVAIVSGESPTSGEESRLAVACYARAMEHVGVMACDPE